MQQHPFSLSCDNPILSRYVYCSSKSVSTQDMYDLDSDLKSDFSSVKFGFNYKPKEVSEILFFGISGNNSKSIHGKGRTYLGKICLDPNNCDENVLNKKISYFKTHVGNEELEAILRYLSN
ncbi:MAG: hypothetical protein VXZ40_01090 [Nanoarchaeota archaeon]|nr:hypothetical protein [Nanoarchaeota archaeon]